MSPMRGFSSKERNAIASTIVAVPMMMAPTPRTIVIAR